MNHTLRILLTTTITVFCLIGVVIFGCVYIVLIVFGAVWEATERVPTQKPLTVEVQP